jgi:hypothetical protein
VAQSLTPSTLGAVECVSPGDGRALAEFTPEDGARSWDRIHDLLDDAGTTLRRNVVIPGLFFGVRALLDGGLVLYEGYPTTGAHQTWFGPFGFTWPHTAWTIKLADLESGAFTTLIPDFEYQSVAFSPVRVEDLGASDLTPEAR